MSSFDRLRVYLEARAAFTESELETIKAVFVPMALRPGEFLQRAGEPARHAAFVAQGCIRMLVLEMKQTWQGDFTTTAMEAVRQQQGLRCRPGDARSPPTLPVPASQHENEPLPKLRRLS